MFFFFFQAEDGIRGYKVTGVQTCALPILGRPDSLHRKNAPHFPLVYLEGPSSQQTRDDPRWLQRSRRGPLRLPRQMGRPSPPRPPSPPPLALIKPSRCSHDKRRNSSSNSILSLGIEWFSEVQNERARNETNHEKSGVRTLFIVQCAPLARASAAGRTLAGI